MEKTVNQSSSSFKPKKTITKCILCPQHIARLGNLNLSPYRLQYNFVFGNCNAKWIFLSSAIRTYKMYMHNYL